MNKAKERINELVNKYFEQIKETINCDEVYYAYLSFRVPMDMLKGYIQIKNINPSLLTKLTSPISEEYSETHWPEVEKIYEDRERFAKEFWKETNLIERIKEYAESKDSKMGSELLDVLDFLENPEEIICDCGVWNRMYNFVEFTVQEII